MASDAGHRSGAPEPASAPPPLDLKKDASGRFVYRRPTLAARKGEEIDRFTATWRGVFVAGLLITAVGVAAIAVVVATRLLGA